MGPQLIGFKLNNIKHAVKHPDNRWLRRKRLVVIADAVLSQVLLNHFCADGRRCGQPGQQQGLRLPSFSSSV